MKVTKIIVAVTVYPTLLKIMFDKSEETPQNVQLMDLNGGIVLSAKKQNEINVSNLQEGLYLMVCGLLKRVNLHSKLSRNNKIFK